MISILLYFKTTTDLGNNNNVPWSLITHILQLGKGVTKSFSALFHYQIPIKEQT